MYTNLGLLQENHLIIRPKNHHYCNKYLTLVIFEIIKSNLFYST